MSNHRTLPGEESQAPGESTTERVKEAADSVASDAKEQVQQVATHAADETKEVAAEAKNEVEDLYWRSRSELSQQGSQQQQRIAEGLRDVGQELDEMASANHG